MINSLFGDRYKLGEMIAPAEWPMSMLPKTLALHGKWR